MSKKKLAIIIVLIILVSGAVYRFWSGRPEEETGIRSQDIITVERGDLEQTVSATGNIAAVREREYTAESGGEIEALYVSEGDRVETGDPLVELDSRQQRLSLLQAQRDLESARINGSQREIEERELEVEIAQQELDKRSIEASFEGIITDVEVETGDRVAGSDLLLTLMDLSSYQVEIEVDESDSRLVEEGQKAIIELDAFTGQQFSGRVFELKRRAVSDNGMSVLPGTVTVENNNPDFRPGYSADLDIVVEKEEDEILVPVTAIHSEGGQDYVYLREGEQFNRIEVETSLSDGLQTVITSGLEPGDEILVNTALRPGSEEPENDFGPGGGPGGPPGGGF